MGNQKTEYLQGFNLWGTIKQNIYRTNPYTKNQTKMSKGNLILLCKELTTHKCKFLWMRKSLHTITYLLTPWCRVLLEKLTGLQLVKKFPAFHGTRRFITALTSIRHLSLSWASPIQSIYPQPPSWRSVLILSTHLRLGLPCGLLPSSFPTKTLYTLLS